MQLPAQTNVSALPPIPAPHNGDVDGTVQPTMALDVTLSGTTGPSPQLHAPLALEGTEGTLQHQHELVCLEGSLQHVLIQDIATACQSQMYMAAP